MQPFALTLARNGFAAITFDFPGHGRNSDPMRGGLTDPQASLRALLASMAQMGDYAHTLALADGGSGRYAVVGHSMASDIVVRHAQARTCRLRLEQENGSCRLEIQDDGVGTSNGEGNGLRGMRERVEMLGGTLLRDTEAGTTLVITLPVKETVSNHEGRQN
jgi:signal transduction histidine kinase